MRSEAGHAVGVAVLALVGSTILACSPGRIGTLGDRPTGAKGPGSSSPGSPGAPGSPGSTTSSSGSPGLPGAPGTTVTVDQCLGQAPTPGPTYIRRLNRFE